MRRQTFRRVCISAYHAPLFLFEAMLQPSIQERQHKALGMTAKVSVDLLTTIQPARRSSSSHMQFFTIASTRFVQFFDNFYSPQYECVNQSMHNELGKLTSSIAG
jgi:hypothetical protein